MGTSQRRAKSFLGRLSRAGVVGVLVLVALSGVAVAVERWKLLVVGWVAFVAMAGAAPLGARAADTDDATRLVWGYGLASGAMVTSAAVFLVPQAIGYQPRVGGFGVAAGLLVGFGAHTVGHRLSHRDASVAGFDVSLTDTVTHLTVHALSAGAIIGLVYTTMPDLGLLLGLAIVSHKGPAGYAAARRLGSAGRSWTVLLVPAAGVGVASILTGVIDLPTTSAINAGVFGFAAGIFLHVAMDFLPECEAGSEVGEAADLAGDAHARLDRLRVHAVASTAFGSLAVALAWLVVG